VDAVMIGRGALRNPFIFEQAEALWNGFETPMPGIEDYLKLMEDQQAMLAENYPPRMAMIHARKFLAWYSAGFPGCHEFRRKVFSIAEPEALWAEARLFFEKSTQQRDLQFMSQPFLMGGHG